MKTIIKVKLIGHNKKVKRQTFKYKGKDHFEAVQEFNINELPSLKIVYKEVLVLKVK